jgi:cytochrome c-type biogenesis protein
VHITSLNFFNLLAAFGFGALAFLSPCVLPLLPGYLSMMSGHSAADISEGKAKTGRMLRVTLLFVAGFTVVFVALGAAGGTIGGNLFSRNQEVLRVVGGGLVIAMGLFLAVTVVWTPRLFFPFMRERRIEVRPSRLGGWAPPVMGAAFGFAWTPCIGPALGSIITLAAGSGSASAAEGMVLLAVFSVGLGLPFVLAGIGMGKALGLFGWLRRHAKVITVVSGLLLAAFGVLMVTDELTVLNRWFQGNLPEFPWNV